MINASLLARHLSGRSPQIAWQLSVFPVTGVRCSSSSAAWEHTIDTPPGSELIINGHSDVDIKTSSILGAVASTLKV
jgi:hypothetical protein